MFNMPNHVTIAHAVKCSNSNLNAEQRTTSAENAYNAYDFSVGKMYPERNVLPENVVYAIKRNESTTY